MTYLDANSEYLMQGQRIPKVRDPLVYWPSEASAVVRGKIWGKCHRQIYWSIKGLPKTNGVDLDTIRKQRMGIAFEKQEIELTIENPAFSEVTPNYKIRVAAVPDIIISGEFDSIVKKQGKYKIIEYKSGGGRWYRDEVFGTKYGAGVPKDYYLLQVMLYLDIVGKAPELRKYNITEAEIHCLDREKCQVVCHELRLENGYPVVNGNEIPTINIKDIYDRYKMLNYHVINNKLPFGEFEMYYTPEQAQQMFREKKITKWNRDKAETMGYGCDFPCNYCPYLHRCQQTEGFIESFKEIK